MKLIDDIYKKLYKIIVSPASARTLDPAKITPNSTDAEILSYLREPMWEMRPLMRDCYSKALEANGKLYGNLIIKFSVIADNEYGGLVEQVDVDGDQALLDDKFLAECIRENMYAIKLTPPEGSGRITVTYPITLASDASGVPPQRTEPPQQLKPSIVVDGWQSTGPR